MSMPTPLMIYIIIGLLFGICVTLGWRIDIAQKRIDIIHKRISKNSRVNDLVDLWDDEEDQP